MDVLRLAAFSRGGIGGNPAGVALCAALPQAAEMQRIAADIGYSETAFAAPNGAGAYRVRYFAPAAEVPFCGHATIALGAALALRGGDGAFRLVLNDAEVTVEGRGGAAGLRAALVSPPTRHASAPRDLSDAALALFGLAPADLDAGVPTAVIEGGARHLLLGLRDRATLAAMRYDQAAGAALMRAAGLVTISLVHRETPARIHARNAFAAGGVYEDPATGAAAAALGGYLAALGLAPAPFAVLQGEDMGVPCLLHVDPPAAPGGGARVSGEVRVIG